MTNTICDICGKQMDKGIFRDSLERTFGICISEQGIKWDVCDECKQAFLDFCEERKQVSK